MARPTASPWIFASALLLGLGACGDDVATSDSAGSSGQTTGTPGSSSTGVTPTTGASTPTTSAGLGSPERAGSFGFWLR